MSNFLERLDQGLGSFLSDWDITTTFLALIIAFLVVYPIIFPTEPDTHPLLLAKQTSVAPVRSKFESAIYRSPEVPYGSPLRTGLKVKEAGATRWSSGRDGDLRDVWREVMKGGTAIEGAEKDPDGTDNLVPKGKILTVYGREEVVDHDLEQLNKEMQIIGEHLKQKVKGGNKVAIYLPNNIEYLLTIFACSFYGLTPVLLPYNLHHPAAFALINATGANALICAAGALPLDDVAKECKNVTLLTWVVEKTSRHMDWNGVPNFAKKRMKVSVWHDVVEDGEKDKTDFSLPTNESGDPPTGLVTLWDSPTKPEIIGFTQANLIAAIAAATSALPLTQRFNPSDLVLPATSFHQLYVLSQTFAALYAHASLAINSVAQPGVDLALATRGVSPTIIIASAETLATRHKSEVENTNSGIEEIAKFGYSRSLAAGRLPQPNSLLFRFLSPRTLAAQAGKPGTLRLILVADRLHAGTPRLTSKALSDLRIFTRSRICYAVTAARVAGAVAQTHCFDYRIEGDEYGHFGIPLSDVEVWLENRDNDEKVAGNLPVGEIVVAGPAVSGYDASTGKGSVKLGVKARFQEDGTLMIQ